MYVTISAYGAFLLRWYVVDVMLAYLYAINTVLPHCFILSTPPPNTCDYKCLRSVLAPVMRGGMINKYVLPPIYCLHVSWIPDYQAYLRGGRRRG